MSEEPRRQRDPNPTFGQGLLFGLAGVLLLANMVFGWVERDQIAWAIAGGSCIVASAICWRK